MNVFLDLAKSYLLYYVFVTVVKKGGHLYLLIKITYLNRVFYHFLLKSIVAQKGFTVELQKIYPRPSRVLLALQ
jgi:hypothetical protein